MNERIEWGTNFGVCVKSYLSSTRPCPYLPRGISRNAFTLSADRDLYSALLPRGWRRFGSFFFRPNCGGCEGCVSVRVDPNAFTMSRAFRRVISGCKPLRLAVSRPFVDEKRLALYERYHKDRQTSRGWEYEDISPAEYYDYFVDHAQDYGYEFAYYYLDRLAAVALVDILPSGLSAVYCYYDPELKHLSLGTYSILRQIIFAKEQRVPHLYLGYLVDGNTSLSYKARFKPQERLINLPDLSEEPIWSKEDFYGDGFGADTD